MSLAKILKVSGRGVVVPGDDIDTDRIIPARFLKCVTFEGLGEKAFFDERFDAQGKEQIHPLNKHSGSKLLFSGSNFGCGSSREHAPQALYHWGLRAVVAESFAEIFFGNSTALGLVCATMERADLARAQEWVNANPEAEIELDVVKGELNLGGQKWPVRLPENTRRALTEGRWDPLAELLAGAPQARALAQRLPYPAFSA